MASVLRRFYSTISAPRPRWFVETLLGSAGADVAKEFFEGPVLSGTLAGSLPAPSGAFSGAAVATRDGALSGALEAPTGQLVGRVETYVTPSASAYVVVDTSPWELRIYIEGTLPTPSGRFRLQATESIPEAVVALAEAA